MNIFITGISKGLGFALAEQYLKRGDTVWGLARTDNLQLRRFEKYHFLYYDLQNLHFLDEQVRSFLSGISLDIAYLNAASLPEVKKMELTTMYEISEKMAINTWSNKILIDLLLHRTKHICVITSGAGEHAVDGLNVYCISKSALSMMSHLYELENPDVKFSLIDPGTMDTQMQEYLCSVDDKFPIIERLKLQKQESRFNDPVNVAKKLIKIIL